LKLATVIRLVANFGFYRVGRINSVLRFKRDALGRNGNKVVASVLSAKFMLQLGPPPAKKKVLWGERLKLCSFRPIRLAFGICEEFRFSYRRASRTMRLDHKDQSLKFGGSFWHFDYFAPVAPNRKDLPRWTRRH
jgi:hypothetical protein